MLRKVFLPLAIATCAISSAYAADGEAIVKKSGCLACHDVEKKKMGPPYKEVAAKYHGDAGAPAKLAKKVREGGSGTWGNVPMMPNPADKISDADLAAAIEWILSLK